MMTLLKKFDDKHDVMWQNCYGMLQAC